jgi:N-dimethylarginine dimethylaminohydrolase
MQAKQWVGNFKETVFEVNMLVLDEKNVVAMKDYPPLTKWLNDQGITVHFFDLRTRSFWDGGWHCLTLDICREDTKEDLFPSKGDNGVYWRLK